MILTTDKLKSVYQTGEIMRRLVYEYCDDLGPWLDVPFIEYYKFVCALPYKSDPKNIEFVSRPLYTLNPNFNIRDCDDKAVLLACWWVAHGDKCRFVASSTKPNKKLHHVFLQLENGIFIDGTYRKNSNFFGFYPYFLKITRLIPLTDFF